MHARSSMSYRTCLPALLLAVLSVAAPANAQDCAQCHDQTQRLSKSTHSGLDCQTCHEGVKEYPHKAPVAKTGCDSCHSDASAQYELGAHAKLHKGGNAKAATCASCHGDVHDAVKARDAAFRRKVPETCGTCHAEISKQFQESVHGTLLASGNEAAASCTSCHGAHTNLPPRDPEALVNARNIRDTCASCHNNVILARRFQLPLDRVASFDQSFHGLAAKAGSQTVANCASCHGIHNILPSSDPKSTIHPSHLKETCGHCHEGASDRFANARMHWTDTRGAPPAVGIIRAVYLVIIPLVVGLMFLHHAGDYIRKLAPIFRGRAPAPGEPSGEVRMLPAERVQHALLAISFILLALSGFALRYPDTWWAKPVVQFETYWPVRGTIHRIAALIIVGVSVAHVLALAFSRPLREHWKGLLPKWRDLGDAWRTFLYNLGLRKTKPELPSHSYVAKAEYWAVVWGTAVMAITGFLLWANRYTFQWIPREWMDAAAALHLYEAILATFAVLVWHAYSVILDPDVYPVDPAFLTGKSGRRVRKAEEPPDAE